jgi:hypothetical protein
VTMSVIRVHMSPTVKSVNCKKMGQSKFQSALSVKLHLHSLKKIQNLNAVVANRINFYRGGTSVLLVHSTPPHALKSLEDPNLACLHIPFQSKDAHVYPISISMIKAIALTAISIVRPVPTKRTVTHVNPPLSCKMESVSVGREPI